MNMLKCVIHLLNLFIFIMQKFNMVLLNFNWSTFGLIFWNNGNEWHLLLIKFSVPNNRFIYKQNIILFMPNLLIRLKSLGSLTCLILSMWMNIYNNVTPTNFKIVLSTVTVILKILLLINWLKETEKSIIMDWV